MKYHESEEIGKYNDGNIYIYRVSIIVTKKGEPRLIENTMPASLGREGASGVRLGDRALQRKAYEFKKKRNQGA